MNYCAHCGAELTGRQRRFCSEECSKAEVRRERLAKNFALTEEDYEKILDYQGGTCAMCGEPPKPGVRLAVDHDHKSGVVRGLLNYKCNRVILGARSDEAIRQAYEYITNPPAVAALGREVIAPGRTRKRPRRRKVKK